MTDHPEGEGGGLGPILPHEPHVKRRVGLAMRLRNYFLTGLIIAAPLSITIYITWTFVGWVDGWVKPLIPTRYNPDHYLPFPVPGFGLIVAVILLVVLGATTANLFGRTIIAYGEMLLDRMPLVRSIYRGLKQIFETVLSQTSQSFKDVGLIEYPRPGLWAIVFVATETRGELKRKAGGEEDDLLSVFLPTTPNPTSGFLLFVPRKDVIILDMTVEEAAKVVISGGLVTPDHAVGARTSKTRAKAAEKPEPEAPKNAAE